MKIIPSVKQSLPYLLHEIVQFNTNFLLKAKLFIVDDHFHKVTMKILVLQTCHFGYLFQNYFLFISGKRRYNIKLWKTFTDCFNCLPVAAIVDEKIFCCHGGLSPDLQSMEQIRRIMRPTDVPDAGLLCDLLWSDPDKVWFLFSFMKIAGFVDSAVDQSSLVFLCYMV